MPKRPIRPEDLLSLSFAGDPQLNPSGDQVLYSNKTITDKNKYLSHLFSVDLEGRVRRWTGGESSASSGRWSPDGGWISFISSRTGEIPQIYLISTHGGEAVKLTDFPEGSFGGTIWSPDGSKIAVAFRLTQAELTKAGAKERAEKGLSSPPLVFNDVFYRLDGDGYFCDQRYELWVIDVERALASGGTPDECVTCRYRGDANGEFDLDWSPDSKELALTHSANKRPFVDTPNDQVYRLDVATGIASQIAGLPKGSKTSPKWSPDAKWIAYAGDVDETDAWGVRNSKIYLVPAEGGELKDLTGSQDVDAQVSTLSDTGAASFGIVLEWAPNSLGLYLQVGAKGETQLSYVSIEGGITQLTEGRHTIGIGNVSNDGRRIAATFGEATKLSEVAVLEKELVTGRWVAKILTDLNHSFYAEIELAEPREVWIPTTDGLQVHAWILRPLHVTQGKTPAVLQVHGGPHAQYGWAFFHEFQCQVAEGYTVVYSNPRGSKGYGEDWTSAIRGNWGEKDWQDVQAVTGWMKEQPDIDPARMAIMGGSYGGFMTNWAIGHTDEFKCAITDRCVSNMVSMAGNSDFPFNRDGYFKGVAWGDLAEIEPLWKQSPIAYFDKVKTPTLIIHSAGDLRCNIEQSEQVFTALQQEGIESRMVRYPESTSHGMSRNGPPDLRLHRLGEILNWLTKFLK